MQLHKRIAWLISIMVVITFCVEIVTFVILYKTSFSEERKRLSELAKSQARLIESISRFNNQYNGNGSAGAKAATLSVLIDSHDRYRRFSKTGEVLLAEKRGDKIFFVFGHKGDEIIKPEPVPANWGLAEPMLLALSGKSGTVIGLDYSGQKVLAAYEHVADLDIGLVAKINLSEIRAPFIRAFIAIVLIGIMISALGVSIFIGITNPMINAMKKTIEDLQSALKRVKQLSGLLPICASCKKIRDDKGYWNQIESYIRTRSEADFSHSICPDCAKKLYPDLDIYEA